MSLVKFFPTKLLVYFAYTSRTIILSKKYARNADIKETYYAACIPIILEIFKKLLFLSRTIF